MQKFWPMKLLCKLVANPLKPTVCAHLINLCNSLGSGLSDLHHCIGCGRGPWLESVINFPFLPVALSWRPSLFPLGDSDIRHNRSCQTLWNPRDCSMPGLPVLRHLPKFAQIHVHWVGDAIQPSHPLPLPSPFVFNLSQHQGIFQWVCSSHQVTKVLELQYQSLQWIFKVALSEN